MNLMSAHGMMVKRTAPSITTYKYQTVINKNFKKSNRGFGSSDSRFFKNNKR